MDIEFGPEFSSPNQTTRKHMQETNAIERTTEFGQEKEECKIGFSNHDITPRNRVVPLREKSFFNET